MYGNKRGTVKHRQIRDQLVAYNPDVYLRVRSSVLLRFFFFVCRSLVPVCMFVHAEALLERADGTNMDSILPPKI